MDKVDAMLLQLRHLRLFRGMEERRQCLCQRAADMVQSTRASHCRWRMAWSDSLIWRRHWCSCDDSGWYSRTAMWDNDDIGNWTKLNAWGWTFYPKFGCYRRGPLFLGKTGNCGSLTTQRHYLAVWTFLTPDWLRLRAFVKRSARRWGTKGTSWIAHHRGWVARFRSKVSGGCHNPNAIQLPRNAPRLVTHVVLSRSLSSIVIRRKPQLTSFVE